MAAALICLMIEVPVSLLLTTSISFSQEEKEVLKVIRDHATAAMVAQGESRTSRSFGTGNLQYWAAIEHRCECFFSLFRLACEVCPSSESNLGCGTGTTEISPLQARARKAAESKKERQQKLQNSSDPTFLTQQRSEPRSPIQWGAVSPGAPLWT